MNKLLKKTLAALSCAIIIGQVMFTSIVGATDESLDKNQITIPIGTPTSDTTDGGDSGTNDNSNTNTNNDSETKPCNNTGNECDDNGPGASDVDNPGFETGDGDGDGDGNGDGNGDNDGPGAGDIDNPGHDDGNGDSKTTSEQCDNIKLTFMNSLTEMINNEINNKRAKNTGSDHAAFDGEDTIVLDIKEKDTIIHNLSGYIRSLQEYIGVQGYIAEEYISNYNEYGFWTGLVSRNTGLYLSITNGVSLISLSLGNDINKFTTIFNRKSSNECEFSFYINFEPNNSNGNDSENNGNGYSGKGKSSNGGSNTDNNSDNSNNTNNSNDESLTLSGEVSDEVMEVKKAESCSTEGSTFSEEENQAYLWSCEKGITIADNIMKADMNNNLTRAELAKMMSIYSEELLGRTRIKNKGVTYPDVDSSLGDLEYYIQEGYRLQIMGIHADGSALSKFSPNSNVTRGEFGTVFSRVLHGNIYNIGNSHYYEKHLDVLKNEGILKNTNPKLIEKRGWILLMLYRSQKVEESNGNISNEEIVNITGEKEEAKNETGENIAEVETGNNTETSGN